jgi:hypothetical protein
MIFPSCETISYSTGVGSNCQIHIVYNQQKPLCDSRNSRKIQDDCRLPDELCSVDPQFRFDFNNPQVSFAFTRLIDNVLTHQISCRGTQFSKSHLSSKMGQIRCFFLTLRRSLRCQFHSDLVTWTLTGFRILFPLLFIKMVQLPPTYYFRHPVGAALPDVALQLEDHSKSSLVTPKFWRT